MCVRGGTPSSGTTVYRKTYAVVETSGQIPASPAGYFVGFGKLLLVCAEELMVGNTTKRIGIPLDDLAKVPASPFYLQWLARLSQQKISRKMLIQDGPVLFFFLSSTTKHTSRDVHI